MRGHSRPCRTKTAGSEHLIADVEARRAAEICSLSAMRRPGSLHVRRIVDQRYYADLRFDWYRRGHAFGGRTA
jgi:hypothetical protein